MHDKWIEWGKKEGNGSSGVTLENWRPRWQTTTEWNEEDKQSLGPPFFVFGAEDSLRHREERRRRETTLLASTNRVREWREGRRSLRRSRRTISIPLILGMVRED